MARFIIMETKVIDKLQQMVSDEIEASESVILRYNELGNSTQSLEWELENLKTAAYQLAHSKKAV